MYQVIARKYRPQGFDDVVGQEHVKTTLRNAIAQNRIAHGYIFSGQRGTGKTTMARIIARCLNCIQGPTATPCGVCASCLEIEAGGSVDVIEIDAASNRGINEMRELRENVRYQPARDRYKVFIVDEAHQITSEAFNALLKTIEEPPAWAVFVLCTTEAHKIPASDFWAALKSAAIEVAPPPKYHRQLGGGVRWWQPKTSTERGVPVALERRIEHAVSWVLNPLSHSQGVDRYRPEIEDAVFAMDELESVVRRAISIQIAGPIVLRQMLLTLLSDRTASAPATTSPSGAASAA